jgi:hypothetical protein
MGWFRYEVGEKRYEKSRCLFPLVFAERKARKAFLAVFRNPVENARSVDSFSISIHANSLWAFSEMPKIGF